ncbi:MAG: hypothetical protein IPG92_07050 [Flavobacteriales bacterium]|nr:hypothetical protein [Flavobacteriales bacterium]
MKLQAVDGGIAIAFTGSSLGGGGGLGAHCTFRVPHSRAFTTHGLL